MAVYRPTGRQGVPRWLWIGGAVIALAVIAGLAALVLRPAPADDITQVKADLTEMISRLDLLTVEYPKQQAGGSSGAATALRAARTAFDRAQPRLARLDPPAAQAQAAALAEVERLVAANADSAQVTAQADTLAALARAWISGH